MGQELNTKRLFILFDFRDFQRWLIVLVICSQFKTVVGLYVWLCMPFSIMSQEKSTYANYKNSLAARTLWIQRPVNFQATDLNFSTMSQPSKPLTTCCNINGHSHWSPQSWPISINRPASKPASESLTVSTNKLFHVDTLYLVQISFSLFRLLIVLWTLTV